MPLTFLSPISVSDLIPNSYYGGDVMTYQVHSRGLSNLSLCEDDTVSEILQNVAMILGTRKGSIPLYRDFGLPMNFLDRPLPVAKNLLYNEVYEALLAYEPRATLEEVGFSFSEETPEKMTVYVEVSRDG